MRVVSNPSLKFRLESIKMRAFSLLHFFLFRLPFHLLVIIGLLERQTDIYTRSYTQDYKAIRK